MRNAVFVAGFGGIGIGAALVWFVIWLDGRYEAEEMVWPLQLGVLVFALAFMIGGAAFLLAAHRWRRPS